MATAKEHIELIRETLHSYKTFDKTDIIDEVILASMNIVRAALIRQQKPKGVDSSFYQLIPCLEIECVSNECEYVGYTISGEGTKQVVLPPLVKDMSPHDIKYLGGDDMLSGGTKLSVEGFSMLEHSRYVKDKFHFLVLGDKVLLKNVPTRENQELKLLTGILLLDNPIDACNFTDDTPYPCPSDYRLQVLTIQHILQAYHIYPDEFNDARDQLRSLGLGRQPQQQQQMQEDIEDE